MAASACGTTAPDGGQPSSAPSSAGAGQFKFFNQADFDKQMAQRTMTPGYAFGVAFAEFIAEKAGRAFVDAGKPVPPLTGEDEQDFLALWQKDKLTAIAPTYPVYQWRTAVIAVTCILSGKQVPKEWVLPQPVITADNLSQYLTTGMPPLFSPRAAARRCPASPRSGPASKPKPVVAPRWRPWRGATLLERWYPMRLRGTATIAVLAAVCLVAAACSKTPTISGQPSTPPSATAKPGQSKYFSQADFDKQMAQRRIAPNGDPATPWLQMIQPSMVDTSKYAKSGKWHVCFSNAAVDNPWRVTGLTTMKAEAKLHPEIGEFTIVDAGGKDEKQIADLADLQAKKCDAIIVSPNTTPGLTPAVEKLCQSGIPVIVFDRGVTTDCPVSFVHPIGGYAFGAASAEFIALKVGKGGKVLAMRLLPDVDVLEARWDAAKIVFEREGIDVVGVEFNNADPAKAKSIVTDYLQRFGKLDGVWLDASFASVAVTEAFKAAGKPVPPLNGEDQQEFLTLWQKEKLNAIAPTYPVYQWRTAVIAATYILSGKQVPKEWVLPQPVITADTLSKYITPNMPAEFFPTCGCQKMPGFPKEWGGR
jgi:ribose transport system substrate-binding protein